MCYTRFRQIEALLSLPGLFFLKIIRYNLAMKNMRILTFLASISLALQPQAFAAGDDWQRHYDVGKDFLDRQQYELAVKEFDLSLKQKVTPKALVDRGTCRSEMGKYQEALADLDQAIRMSPDFGLAHVNRGVVYFRTGQADKAIADFDRALLINGKDQYAMVNRAGAYMMLPASKAAILAQNTEKLLDATNWRIDLAGHAAVLTALTYNAGKQPDKARALMQKALNKLNRLHWPYPVCKYLLGKAKEEDVLEASADSTYDLTQAQAFLAIDLLNKGDKARAREKLSFVTRHGTVNSVEYWLAKYLSKP